MLGPIRYGVQRDHGAIRQTQLLSNRTVDPEYPDTREQEQREYSGPQEALHRLII